MSRKYLRLSLLVLALAWWAFMPQVTFAVQFGAGTGSGYPAALDSTNARTNAPGYDPCSSATSTNACAEFINDIQDATVEIETELGVLPKGGYATVKARLDAALYSGGALGTPSSGSAANLTSFPTLNQNTTGTAATITGLLTSGNMPKADILQGPLSCADAGINDAYACNLSPAITAYVTGTHYLFKANTANTGAATVNLNSVAATTIVKVVGGITTALADNDIRAGQWVDVVYDGTNMQMQSTLGNASGGSAITSGTATVATFETTTSTTFTDLATSGPAVTLTVGPSGILLISYQSYLVNDTLNGFTYVDFALSGGNTRAASTTTAIWHRAAVASIGMRAGVTTMLTGLTAASTTVTLKYQQTAGSIGYFENRSLTAMTW